MDAALSAPTLRLLAWIEIGLALVTVVAVAIVKAPYGRHARAGWGPTLKARTAWVLMEAPASLVFAAWFLFARGPIGIVPVVLFGLWQIHYAYRAFVYPFRIRPSGKRTPLLVVLLAVLFNLLNATVNAPPLLQAGAYPSSWLHSPQMVVGVSVFAVGLVMNHHSDWVLRNLRQPGQSGYQIPRGGLYGWVSCPNYLGEMLEWLGWAIATWSLPGLAFFLYTVANLGPRAMSNHRWYQDRFPDYPASRKALIPYLL